MSEHPINQSTIAGANDPLQRKRLRAGSISGRLRTASDLEESGIIDKAQKGLIKDLIISGDPQFQSIIEKYERGDKRELEELIKSGQLMGRRESIDLLDDLDFEFLNGIRGDLEGSGDAADDFLFDFGVDPSTLNKQGQNAHPAMQSIPHIKLRTASTDSAGFDIFDTIPYDSANPNSLLDELQYLNKQYNESVSPRHRTNSLGGGLLHGTGTVANNAALSSAGGTPHISFSKYLGGLDPSVSAPGESGAYPGMGNLTGHKGRRDSWDIAAQYIQQEEDYSRSLKSSGLTNHRGGAMSGAPAMNSAHFDALNAEIGVKGGSPADATKAAPSVLNNRKINGSNLAKNNVNTLASRTSNAPLANSAYTSPLTGYSAVGVGNGNGGASGMRSGVMSYVSTSSHHALPLSSTNNHNYNPDDAAAAVHGVGSHRAGLIGAYTPEQRRMRIDRFIEKRNRRVWTKKVKYDVRKNFADSRLRVKGRFVKKEDEEIMREILSI